MHVLLSESHDKWVFGNPGISGTEITETLRNYRNYWNYRNYRNVQKVQNFKEYKRRINDDSAQTFILIMEIGEIR